VIGQVRDLVRVFDHRRPELYGWMGTGNIPSNDL